MGEGKGEGGLALRLKRTPYGPSGVELSKSYQSDLPPFPFLTPAPWESLLAGEPAYKAFIYPALKGVTNSDVTGFENPLICPSLVKR